MIAALSCVLPKAPRFPQSVISAGGVWERTVDLDHQHFVRAGTFAVSDAPALSPLVAARAAWKAQALKEAAFARRLLDAASDPIGLPMPPTDSDDGGGAYASGVLGPTFTPKDK